MSDSDMTRLKEEEEERALPPGKQKVPPQFEWVQLLLQPVADAYKLRLSSVIGLSDYKEHKLLRQVSFRRERNREREGKK